MAEENKITEITEEDLRAAFYMEPEDIVKFFGSKGLKTSFNWYEVYEDAHARAFTVAKMTDLDLLSDTKDLLERTIEEGKSYNAFKKEAMELFEKKGWVGFKEVTNDKTGETKIAELGTPRRLKTIYTSNINSAYAAGRYKEQLEEADIAPYWQYMTISDERTRPAHRAMHGKIFRYDDEFWNNFYPHNGWCCRCFVRNLSKREVEDAGLTVEKTEGKIKQVTEIVGGEEKQNSVYTFSKGGNVYNLKPDAGWATNVGKFSWGIDVAAWNKVKDLDENIKIKFLSQMAANPHKFSLVNSVIEAGLEHFGKPQSGKSVIAWLSPNITQMLINNKAALKTPLINITEKDISHILRNKKNINQKLTKDQVKNLYKYINNPDEIWLDTMDNSLNFIVFLPQNEIVENKDCIKINIKIDKSNKNTPINYIGSAGRMERVHEMTDKTRYKKIE
ncbi:MAG: phage minor head protein [Candidatus Gastranaerophilaceae bacterium]